MVGHGGEDGGGHNEGEDDGNRLRHGGGGNDVDIVGHGDGDGATVELLQEFMAATGGESGANVQTGKHIVKHSYAESLQGILVTIEEGWCTCGSENIGWNICNFCSCREIKDCSI